MIGFNSDELDEWVKERTIRLGAVPGKLLNNRAFWRTYLPLYRANCTPIGKYRFEELNLKTDIQVAIVFSETDTLLVDMKLWENYYVGLCEYY